MTFNCILIFLILKMVFSCKNNQGGQHLWHASYAHSDTQPVHNVLFLFSYFDFINTCPVRGLVRYGPCEPATLWKYLSLDKNHSCEWHFQYFFANFWQNHWNTMSTVSTRIITSMVLFRNPRKTLKACPINPNNSQGWATSKERLSCYSGNRVEMC